jgi:hypothetical protein
MLVWIDFLSNVFCPNRFTSAQALAKEGWALRRNLGSREDEDGGGRAQGCTHEVCWNAAALPSLLPRPPETRLKREVQHLTYPVGCNSSWPSPVVVLPFVLSFLGPPFAADQPNAVEWNDALNERGS